MIVEMIIATIILDQTIALEIMFISKELVITKDALVVLAITPATLILN